MLLWTGVSHTRTSLQAAARHAGTPAVELAPGLLEVSTDHPQLLMAALRRRLSSVESDEVRAVVLDEQSGHDLVAAALGAPSLTQLVARARHADLLPLFSDELRAFRSVYQPIVELGADPAAALGSAGGPPVVGFEALLRATGPHGEVMPAALFQAATQAGWLHVLDRVGRTTALRGAAGWLGRSQLFVNFLPTTIYRPEVCLATTELAARHAGLRLDQLVFEVTESEQVSDLDHLADVFAYYRERGCQVALDDLGSGYSSLNMLVRLQPDVVKLDKDIVQRLPDPVSRAVVSAVVDITHAYGGRVLAECVETVDQARAAQDLGVDLGQGWFFGHPQERRATDHEPLPAPARPARTPVSALCADGNDAAVAVPRAAGESPRAHATAQAPRGTADVEALMARALHLTTTGVTIADVSAPDMPLIYANDAFETITGHAADEVLGRNCRFLQTAATDPEAVRSLSSAIKEHREHTVVMLNVRKDGQPFWNELRVTPVTDASGRLTHYLGFQNDVTERVEAQQHVAHLAAHDPLTGLPNRESILRQVDVALARARRDGTQLAVLFVDLDEFTKVNDDLGHAAGDLALVATAARLRGALREQDLLGRLGGDEFLVALTDVPPHLALSVARRAAATVIDTFRSPLSLTERATNLSASVGIAVFPQHASTTTGLVNAADRAMHEAKTAGRARAASPRDEGPARR